LPQPARPEDDGESRLTAEIIEFPMRQHKDPQVSAVAGLEEIVREVDLVAAEPPAPPDNLPLC
jgi:hypothetical protein